MRLNELLEVHPGAIDFANSRVLICSLKDGHARAVFITPYRLVHMLVGHGILDPAPLLPLRQ